MMFIGLATSLAFGTVLAIMATDNGDVPAQVAGIVVIMASMAGLVFH